MEASWTEVDGVPTLFAAAGEVQGPLHAVLMFATGRSRRDPATRRYQPRGGAPRPAPLQLPARRTRSTDAWITVMTMFWAQGSDEQVAEFLASVAQGLGDLPVDRLADELRGARDRGRAAGAAFEHRLRPRPPLRSARRRHRQLSRVRAAEHHPRRRRRLGSHALRRFERGALVLGPVPPGLRLPGFPRTPRPETAPLPPLLTHGRSFAAVKTPRVSLSCVYSGWSGVNAAMYLARQRARATPARRAQLWSWLRPAVHRCRAHARPRHGRRRRRCAPAGGTGPRRPSG